MVRPEPGSPDITLACLSAAEVDLDRCWDGDLGHKERLESGECSVSIIYLEFVGAEHEVLALFS